MLDTLMLLESIAIDSSSIRVSSIASPSASTSNAGASRGADIGISSSGNWESIAIDSSSIRVSSIASITKTSIAITTIEKSRVSLSFTLGNMDNSGRVSNITSSTGISTSKGGDGSRCKSSNAGASRGADGCITSSGNWESITITSIKESRISLSFSFTLGNMDNSGRVGYITSGTSISSSESRDSSGSKSSNAGASRGADGGITSSGNWESISIDSSSIRVGYIAGISKTSIAITSVKESCISISLWLGNSHGSKTSNSQEFVHDCGEHYPLKIR